MRKQARHELIKEMIGKERLGRQLDIQQRLEKRGVVVTQTTLSRDLRELGLTKVYEGKQSFYILPNQEGKVSLFALLANSTRKVERASFVLVFHTELGEAALLANAIDREQPQEILGTIAGADTLLVICCDEACARFVETSVIESMR